MSFPLLQYDEPLFRPPSEAGSIIIQVTIGCSWNSCAFCEMYSSKDFRVIGIDEIRKNAAMVKKIFPERRKVFLADGNPMVLSTEKLLNILEIVNEEIKNPSRISAYASSSDLRNKSVGDLKKIRDAGLKLLYIGIETGDDELLSAVNKKETSASLKDSLLKAKEAGIKLSVMIINGLGGVKFSHKHALNSARLVNEIKPEYLSTLVLSFPYGIEHFKKRFRAEYQHMAVKELLHELKLFISATELTETVFRSDHASNFLVLKGILNRDKDIMIELLNKALIDPFSGMLRQDWQRGL